jgi:Phage related hypothetical protein (DUF1799)
VASLSKGSCQQRKKLAQVARLWASGQINTSPQDQDDEEFDCALAALGLALEGAEEDTVAPIAQVHHIWPDCVQVWRIWLRCQTLWRIGIAGREGLDYAGLCTFLREVERVKPRRFAETFACLQAMERAALEVWNSEGN